MKDGLIFRIVQDEQSTFEEQRTICWLTEVAVGQVLKVDIFH